LGYLRYQLGDYLLQRAAIPCVLVLFISGIPLWSTLRGQPDFFSGPRGPFFAMQLYTGAVALFLPVGAFLAGAGIMSTDRQQGYIRFFFSKPINVIAYYVQLYVLHAIVFVLIFGAITWTYGQYTVHFSVHRAMEAAALTFALVGGLGFLFSTLTRFDGGLVVLVYVISMTLQQVVAESRDNMIPSWLRLVSRVLPPANTLDQVRNHLYAREAIDHAQVWHVVGYGGAAFLLGLLALRRLPLSR
jgi:hypothetical protein